MIRIAEEAEDEQGCACRKREEQHDNQDQGTEKNDQRNTDPVADPIPGAVLDLLDQLRALKLFILSADFSPTSRQFLPTEIPYLFVDGLLVFHALTW